MLDDTTKYMSKNNKRNYANLEDAFENFKKHVAIIATISGSYMNV